MYTVPFQDTISAGKHAASLLAQEVQLAGEAAEEARKNRAWAAVGWAAGAAGAEPSLWMRFTQGIFGNDPWIITINNNPSNPQSHPFPTN